MKPAVAEIVYFHDETLFHNGGLSWYWEFGDGATSALQHPSHSYSNPVTYTIVLEATDSAGYSCPTYPPLNPKHEITVELPLPEWKEIPPF